MSVCQCPHCGSPHQIRVTGSGRVSKKQQCEQCGGFIGKLVSGVKKLASNPMVQQAARALAPHAMSALQRHAPGLANVVNRGVNFARQHSGAIQSAMANPRQFAQQQLPGLARQLAPRALQAVESRAPGLVSAARNVAANPMVQRMAASPMAQSGLAALRSRVGMGTGGIKVALAKKGLNKLSGLLGGPQMGGPAPPPPPPRAAFQGIQGFEAPRMRPRASVRGRGTRPPTAHALAVGEVMRTMGMALPQASRYVKQNGLAM
jgi:transposase-like protein